MCFSQPKAPDYQPVADASAEAARYGKEAADNQLAFAREQHAFSQQQYYDVKPLFEQLTNNQMAAQEQQMELGDKYYGFLEDTYHPAQMEQMGLSMDMQRQQMAQSDDYWQRQQKFFGLEDDIIKDAQTYSAQAKQQALAHAARADTERAFGQQDAGLQRQMMAMGVNPNSGKFQSASRQQDTMQAAQSAKAMTDSRTQSDAIARALRMDAAGLGRGLAGAGATSAQTALAAGQASGSAGAQMAGSFMQNPYAGAVSTGNSAANMSMAHGNNYMNQAMAQGTSMQNAYGLGQAGLNTQMQGLGSILDSETLIYNNQTNANAEMMGAAVGGVTGMFSFGSDIRLKENIELIGQYPNGMNQYEFNYRDDAGKQRYRGVMAQEVQITRPDAVITDDEGYMSVIYDLLGVEMEKV